MSQYLVTHYIGDPSNEHHFDGYAYLCGDDCRHDFFRAQPGNTDWVYGMPLPMVTTYQRKEIEDGRFYVAEIFVLMNLGDGSKGDEVVCNACHKFLDGSEPAVLQLVYLQFIGGQRLN